MATPGQVMSMPGMLAGYGAPFVPTSFVGTCGKVYFVGNRSGLPAGDGSKADYPLSTLNAALGKCRSGAGDIVYVLPGHAENVAAADSWSSLVASTKIIGLGTGNDRPQFTWSTATSTVLLDVANVLIENCILLMAGPSGSTALTVAAPMTISGAGCAIRGCRIEVGIDADQLATAAITTTAAADDLLIEGNTVHGAAAAELTTVFQFVGADRLVFRNNNVTAALATDTDGLLQFVTTGSPGILITDNLLHANGTGNTVCIQMSANIVVNGWVVRNFMRNMTDANVNFIVTSGTGVDVQLQWNFGVNNSNERGVEEGTASV